ncbi:PREDICTED: putative methyl-CpG-binding domain protein 3-like 3 [Condylura cristata]|uniref:putative methyl-CpG-binding domain protein 3-like 3 n=1 Tax=Condylura cristata TaxID=143302 RepID=UPI0003343B8F|nr:PREDICTED: putative methyl-CpG-binding domain protein 3-like 3 [Condylura cristata]
MEEPASTSFPRQPVLGRLKRPMMSQTLEKKRRIHVAKTKRRHRERRTFPIRLTSCIFKKQVTRIISHPGNEVRCDTNEETLKKPQQISAYRRLQGLQACSSEGELLSTLDFTNTFKNVHEFLGSGSPESLYTSPESSTAQSSNWVELLPGVGLYLPQPHYSQPVTAGDIRKQSLEVKKARERLAVALRADSLAMETERARSQGSSEN